MLAAIAVAALAAGHVILHKRDVRAAIGWVGLILLSPFMGAAAYYLLGINRIRRRAERAVEASQADPGRPTSFSNGGSEPAVPSIDPSFATLERMVARATHAPLSGGNQVEILRNGERAYPAMLEAIEKAERSILLATYIFDTDGIGQAFLHSLADAVERGVEVRVLIDGVGGRYSRPLAVRALRDQGVTAAEFLPPRIPIRHPYFNLRNHRKLLVVDGAVAFTGGMNIRQDHLISAASNEPTQDVHFRLVGPVVEAVFSIVAQDWRFATGESLVGAPWRAQMEPVGSVVARAIADGPDEDFETLRWTILAALTTARESIRIATPYFLPERPMITALRLAALRGLEVDILLPERSNLRFVQWASMGQMGQILNAGCRVWLVPPPFDHSKILIIDAAWSLVGSANWDARSLRLNFEMNVECYDEALARSLIELTESKCSESRRLTLEDLARRSLPVQLRDGAARLFAPYL